MDQATYSLAEMPFELNEHDFVDGNVYIIKQAIRRRLNKLDPQWRQSEPRMIVQTDRLVTMTGSIIIAGAERFGVGTGIIQRWKKVDGKETEISGYALARAERLAIKSATSDILPRAALEFGIGWYLKLPQAKGIKDKQQLEAFLKRLNDQREAQGLLDQAEQAPPQRPAHVDENGEIRRDEAPATPWPSTSWYADEEARHKFGQFLDQRKIPIAHVVELTDKQPWEFADGRAACEAIVAKLEPAQPRNGKNGKSKAADSPAKTDDGLKVEVHLAHEVVVNPIYNSAFQYVAVCDKGVNIPVVGSDLYKAAGFTEAMIARWKNNKASGSFPEPVEIRATKDGRGHFTLVKVVAPQAVLDDQQRRNAPSPNPVPTDKELEAMGDIPF